MHGREARSLPLWGGPAAAADCFSCNNTHFLSHLSRIGLFKMIRIYTQMNGSVFILSNVI